MYTKYATLNGSLITNIKKSIVDFYSDKKLTESDIWLKLFNFSHATEKFNIIKKLMYNSIDINQILTLINEIGDSNEISITNLKYTTGNPEIITFIITVRTFDPYNSFSICVKNEINKFE